tara:strand:+ start:1556 stop:1906 length:351 start_codon:yes stop_codon:yes gene_type:complete
VGDEVECHVGDGVWAAGTVVALLIREEGMPDGFSAPYRVRIADVPADRLILVKSDDDEHIRSGVDEYGEDEGEEYDDEDDDYHDTLPEGVGGYPGAGGGHDHHHHHHHHQDKRLKT